MSRKLFSKLLNVVQEAYVHGVSTRKVDELKQLDEFVEEFLPLA